MDPRKPVLTPIGDQGEAVLNLVYRHLMTITEVGAKNTGMTGASFVMAGFALWARDLAELDHKALQKLMSALVVLLDPKANEKQKETAEKKRADAVRRLLAAVDLDMTKTAGSA